VAPTSTANTTMVATAIRGHVFANAEGRYHFRTIPPALYPGRARHYHVNMQAPEHPVLTTQLIFRTNPLTGAMPYSAVIW
jgi:protocatechuate 3,4-dioxygenase beta subunit